MGKNNVNKRFTVSLDIDTKDVEKQVKVTAGNLKTILADLGKASDKMGYFKELVNYIGQVDTALTVLRSKNKDAFDHMFDGLDEGLKRQLQELFGASGEQLGKLDILREKLATLTPKSSIKELRSFAKEINDLFTDIGAKSPFEDIDNQFSGRTNADHIKLLTDALDNFATVWNGINEKIKGGFGLGGAGGKSGGITDGLSEEVQAEIDKLNKQIQELESIREKFKELSGVITSIKKGKAISDSYKIDLTAESIQKLMDEFDALKAKMDSGDKTSIDYYNNLLKISEVSLTLKKALNDVRADNSIMKTLQGVPSGSALGSVYSKLYNYGMVQADNVLGEVLNVDKNKDITTLLDTILNKIEAIKTAARNTPQTDSGNIINTESIKKQIDELENQANRLKEIALIFEDIKYEKIAFDDDGTLSDEFAVEKTVEAIQQLIADYRTAAKAKADFEAAGDTSSADYYNNLANMSKTVLQLQEVYENMDDTLEQSLSKKKIGRGNLLDSLEKVAGETEGFFDNIFVSVSDTINKLIDESTVKLQSLRENLKKIESQSKTDGTTGKSGSGSRGGNGSGGSGNGQPITDIDFTALENTIKSEFSSLANKLDNVFKVEVVKNDTTDIQNAINGIKSTIDQISASIDKYKASKIADQNQAAVDAMKNNLTQLYKYVSDVNARKIGRKYQDQEISAAILSDGSISTAYGEDGTVPWDRMASSLVANLTKSLLVDVHSHPWAQFQNGKQRANDFFSGSNGDLGAFRRSKELGAQIAAMITGNIMRTLDLSKLTGAQMNQFRTALADVEKTYANTPEYSKYMEYANGELYYRGQNTLSEQHKVTAAFESLMYKAFERIGYSKDKVDQELFKKYNLTDDKQLTELAERLVQLSQSSQNALSPVERLAEIISAFDGDIYSEKAKVGFEAFQKGELSAAAVFNGLNGKGYKISQDTLDSLYTIDSTKEVSAVESLLTQITSVLDVISSSVSNIDGNTRQSTSEKFDATINDIVDISNGKISEHITQGIKSIFDPLNISDYKNQEVLAQSDSAVTAFKKSLDDLFVKAASGNLDVNELDNVLSKFTLAMSNVQDATKQIELYEARTRDEVSYKGKIASEHLDDKYSELTNFDDLQKLLYLLSQAKIDVNKTKDFYKDGFSTGKSQVATDNNAIVSNLQAIQSTLDSIYGVLQGFTGIEADSKKSLSYKKPVVDTDVRTKEFNEADLSTLDSILQAIQEIGNYLSVNRSNDVAENVNQGNDDNSDLANFIKSKFSQQLALEDTLQAIKTVVDNLYTVLSKENNEIKIDNQDTEKPQNSDAYQLLLSKLPQNVASEDTLLAIKSAIEQIIEVAKSKDSATDNKGSDIQESLGTLVSALTANINALKDAANGIIDYQKAKKTDTTKAMARIQDPEQRQIVSGIAKNSVEDLGTEAEIESLQALANGLVKVEGAFKNANGQWEGFIVKVNEHNKAVDLAIKKHSTFANMLNNPKKANGDDNPYQYSKEEVETRAQKHLDELRAQGKNATVQFKDSGRYTITILEEIDGLSKQIFQTFDENDKKIERTTVTMSNSQKEKLDRLQRQLIDNGVTNGLISDKDQVYNDYQKASDALDNMTSAYSQMDSLSDEQIAKWKQQIVLVQQLGGQVEALVKQRGKDNEAKIFKSDRTKKLSKFDLDKAELQKNIAIPDSFNGRMDDARSAIENATDSDALKIAINNWEALKNEIKATATQQDLYIKKTKETKKTAPKQDTFTGKLATQKTDFAQYKQDVENATGVTDELKGKLVELENQLNSVGDADGLAKWVQSFKNVANEIKSSRGKIATEIIGKANSKFREVDFKDNSNNLTSEQQAIVDKRDELLRQINEYNSKVSYGQNAEISGIEATRDALYQLIDAYKTKYNIENAGGSATKKAYGTAQLQNFTGKYNDLIKRAGNVELNSDFEAVQKLTAAYQHLKDVQAKFKVGEDTKSGVGAQKAEEFKQAQIECNRYAQELAKIIAAEERLRTNSNSSGGKSAPVAEDFDDSMKGRAQALEDFVRVAYGASASIGKLNDDMTELSFVVKNGDGTITNMTASLNAARTAIYATAGGTEKATTSFGRFFDELKDKARGITTYLISMTGFQEIWQQVRQGVQYVREIDSALTELKKVTDETDATYSRFLQTMSKTASSVGSTVKDLTNSAADWSRVGYSLEDAGQLAATTAKLLNVSEFASVDEATSALVSALQAFSEDGKAAGIRAEEIVDILNNIGNRYPVATNELAEGLATSGAALVAANNSIEEQVALLSAGNATMQDISTVASGLKIVAARLRGTTTEADDDAESAITNVSKLQEKIKALTAEANGGKGIDIINESGGYKSTYEILSEVSKIFDKMDDISRASLLELIAGKNRSSVVAAILQNGKILDEAYSDALNSAGSSAKELDTYLNSIQGKIDKFNNALQTFWMNLLDSSVIKGIVDAGTALLKFADTFTGKLTIIKAALLVFEKFKSKKTFAEMFKGTIDIAKDTYSAITKIVTATGAATKADVARALASKGLTSSLKEQIIAEAGLKGTKAALTNEQIKATAKVLTEKFATDQLTASQYLAAMSTMGLKTALQALGNVLLKNPIYLVAAAVTAAALAFDYFHTTAQEAADATKEAFDEIQNVVNSTKSTIQSLESELSTLQDKIDALDGKKLSFAEDQELNKLKKQREELEHSLKVQEQLLELQRESSNKQAVASMKAYTKAASEGAKETQDTAKTWGTIGGVAAGIAAAAGILLAIPSGGLSLGATAAGVATLGVAGGVAGNKIGEAAGSSLAENEGTYDSWYETYTKALETARKEEQKALEKYKKDSSNIDKLDKWQEAQQKVSDIETEMYNHLSQMQQYFNGLEYGPDEEINKELDAWYNFLDKFSIDQEASGAEVTALDRIFGENADKEIQTIRDQILEAIESGEDFDFEAAINGSEKLKGILAYVGLEAEDVKNYFTQIGEVAKNAISNDIVSVDTYSKLSEDANNYNEILAQTAEIVSDNTKVTQEYKDSLSELGISEEELSDCFDENNGLIVKNAKELNKLVKTSSKNVANNVKLAKSQARLQYYKLVKQLNSTLNGTKKLDSATRASISTTLSQIDAVEQAIYKYQLLEDSLLGTTNAFDEFAKAQEIDALNTYGDSYVEMVQTMYDALYKTGQVGTEQFKAAVEALVPDNIYQGLAEEADRMQAIFDYFNSSIAPTLTLDDGTFSIDYNSIENFVNKAIEAKVLLGDVKNFDLAEGMNLEKAAELMGMTTTQAYAFFAELDKYNTGSEQSFLSQLDDSLDGRIMNITTKVEELNRQKLALLEDGGYDKNKEAIDSINQQLVQCDKNLAATGTEARNMWQEYSKNDVALKALESIQNKQQEITKEGAITLGLEWDEVKGKTIQQVYDEILAKQQQLGMPTELTLQFAKENIESELNDLEKRLKEKTIDIEANVVWNEKDKKYEAADNSQYANDKDLQKYISLQNEGYSIDNYLEGAMTATEEYLNNIQNILQSMYDFQTGKDTETTQTDSTQGANAPSMIDAPEFNFDDVKKIASDIGAFFTDTVPEVAGDVYESLNKFFTETVPQEWDEFWNSVGEFLAPFGDKVQELYDVTNKFFTETIPQAWNEFWTGVGESLIEFGNNAEEVYNVVSKFFKETIPQKWEEFWNSVDDFLTEDAPYAIGYAAGVVARFFTVTIPEKWDEFWENVGEFIDDVITDAKELRDAINKFFSETIPEKWNEMWDNINQFYEEVVDPVVEDLKNAVSTFFNETLPTKWNELWDSVDNFFTVTIPNAVNDAKDAINEFFTVTLPEKWNEFWDSINQFINTSIIPALSLLQSKLTTFFTETVPAKWNEFLDSVSAFFTETIPNALRQFGNKITEFFTVIIPAKWSDFWASVDAAFITPIATAVQTIGAGITNFFTVTVPNAINGMWNSLTSWINEKVSSIWSNLTAGFTAGFGGGSSANGTAHVRGTAHSSGTAHAHGTANKSGSWGAPRTETALTGELGTELLVRGNRWFTVGENGAEFTQVKKGDIIFNHEQTKSLLSNGYVTSRGKLQGGSALASGTAYAGLWQPINGPGSGNGSGSGSSDDDDDNDIADDAEQVVDFIEMKLEEIEAIIEKTSSRIANFLDDTTDIKSKDELYDELVKAEKDKSEAYLKAAQKYNVEAAAALSGVPQQYQEMARNGAIAIKDFIGEDQVEIAEKIQEYRDWAAKADEAENGHLEAIAAISAHRVEQLEDIATDFENIVSISKSHSDLLQAEMDFIEESGGRLSESYYEELKKHSQKQLDDMQAERKALQKILDDAVAAGDVVIGSDDWYSMLETIYDVDKEIVDCKTSLEEFQNAINDLYWDNFDKLIDEIDNVDSELSNLYDLISDDDKVVDEMGNWTDDGITALGLLAQQMEVAQQKSKEYGEAIEQLKKDYAEGLYSTDEYNEKLAELTDGQYDAIQSYEDAKDAIISLNKTRVDAVKDGLQKEIDAYSELIEKKKESLNSDKEAYDFQKQVQESNKNIKDIERKIAALEGNTSSSAMAQRKRLEAELLKAREELNDLYYDHSIEKQQEALDKELEDYTQNKQDQMDALDEYLKNEEQVITDSFDLVTKNAEIVVGTLTRISEEYGVTISDTIATPWINGTNAIGTYEEQLNTSVSATTKNLETLKKQLEDLQTQADKTANSIVKATHSTIVETNDGHQTSIKGYAKGSKSVEKDQWALINELGDELQLVPSATGRLDYIKKGTGILNNTLTERLMNLAMNPASMIESNRPVIGTPGITTTNNTITINENIASLITIEHLDGSNPTEVAKLVDQAWEKKMQTLNNSIKKFTR